MRRRFFVLRSIPGLLLSLTVGCTGSGADRRAMPVPVATSGGWRAVVTPADRGRLRGWRDAWITALAAAAARGGDAKIAAEGVLLRPDAAIAGVTPPPGAYRCRMVKIGARSATAPPYRAYPGFACRIDAAAGGTLALAKLDGSQRPVGLLYPQDADRMIFLGTMMLGDERRALDYGRDAERDMAGALERIGPRRWRLLLPAPRWESLFDVMELVPA